MSGYGIPDFDSGAFPEQIETLFLSTKSTFEIHANFAPRNTIELFIDFKRSRLPIDFISMPSNPTDNGTVINISGLEEPWVIETYDKLKEFFDARLNNDDIYIEAECMTLLFMVMIPLFLYMFYRFEVRNPAFIDSVPKVTIIAIYVYSFLFVGTIGRLLFQYARWLFPRVEYTSDRRWSPTAQRAFLVTVMIGIIGAAVYDAIKFFL